MTGPVTANIPHRLGKVEARRRLAAGLADVEKQIATIMPGVLSFSDRWDGDRLSFEGSGLGQRISGRLDVLEDSVHIQIDLPEFLALLVDHLKSRLTRQTQVLLKKK
jgi:hypothetical protein